ncbi:MAG: hypothetical protein NZM37_03445 [Sandaracinaceae bacterium]|nr:hypothetical protein [Sandaracinaceae bacterium]
MESKVRKESGFSYPQAFAFGLVLLWGLGCSEPREPPRVPDGGPLPIIRCSPEDDPDNDTISSVDEGEGDVDGDGRPNFNDNDADGDGISDIDEAGDRDCQTLPTDRDRDGIPDFIDTDANGDGVADREQVMGDLDRDGTPDHLDIDIDGDGIWNTLEVGDDPNAPSDTDGDGSPDVRDSDSDNDTISDEQEGASDSDGDGVLNFRDNDSDGDGIPDREEAGDQNPNTAPFHCSIEVDHSTCSPTGVRCEIRRDGIPDFLDIDSDNDGLGDGQERALGSDPCNVDTDQDGQGDLMEGVYQQLNCPRGGRGAECGCVTNSGCRIPDRHFYLVLPYGDPPVERTLEFSTTIRVADVFFVTDTTGSMGGTLENVKRTVAGPGGLIERIVAAIPDAWVGGGQFDDMPFGTYGAPPDEPFIRAITMTPPERASEVQAAFNRIELHGGGDRPESATQALWQIMTGEGNTWRGPGGFWGGGTSTYTIRHYAGDCLDGHWGAPCFRPGALPIVVMFTDACSHNGPPDDDPSCDPYMGITPPPARWVDMVELMRRKGARFVGINASTDPAESCRRVPLMPGGQGPCWFLYRTAVETGTVDFEGNALIYDLPNTAGHREFAETVAGAIERVATRVPIDVDTAARDDPSDPERVDARRFIKRRTPACNPARPGAPPTRDCWDAPAGVPRESAVAHFDLSTFYGVVPGARVRFRITFQNDFYVNLGQQAKVFIAFIDVRAGGGVVLDTRQVFIVVPAGSGSFG